MKIIMKKKNRNLICTYKSAMFSTQYASNSSVTTGVGSGEARGACAPHFFDRGGAIVCLCPPTFNPTFLFST